ncbi:HNH endonuclease family protein [Streptosporangium carneum]|uniref:GmrSD restriction endonucleases C-terminal domain-containing protein n=1 Tax=Streptosporangium carneum TaxID=47481 RepID=A0A9W6I0M5_9ACTN|nr:HNH endonuclease family protein [Streptosporangium carneum]GLK09517.1 hypothetical protein GCM10017600_29230 [Streptosporangium carneum]
MVRSALRRGAIAATIAFTLTGCGLAGQAGSDSSAPKGQSSAEALKDLNKLQVKGRAPMTGFDRDQFGPAWSDVDHNGCDTRNDILKRDLKDETFKQGTHDCIVLTGTLDDPYSGRTIKFERGQKTSSAVQIDHVVALADAWQKGAQQWSESKRKELANDPLNLLAVDGPLNSQKGAGDAATWMPPRRTYWCSYASRQIQVKAKYGLWVTAAEKDAMQTALKTC